MIARVPGRAIALVIALLAGCGRTADDNCVHACTAQNACAGHKQTEDDR